MKHSENIKDLSAALSAAQGEMPVVAFDSTNPFLKNKYASLGAVIEASRPVLAKHGLAVTQLPTSEGELIGVETVLTHQSGQYLSNAMLMHPGDEKGKSRAQVAGSIITYLRRYAWAATLGLYADEDTDGTLPEPPARPPARTAPPAGRPAPTRPAAAPARTAAAAAAPAESPEQRLTRFINACRVAGADSGETAAGLFIEMGWLLENEDLSALSVNRLPKTKNEADNILEEIRSRSGAVDDVPGAEAPPAAPPARRAAPAAPPAVGIPEGALEISGFLKTVTKKPAGRQGGNRYGLLIVQDMEDRQGGDWLNTFNATDGDFAESLKGQWITCHYTESQFGKDLVKHAIAVTQ